MATPGSESEESFEVVAAVLLLAVIGVVEDWDPLEVAVAVASTVVD